jgi:beta-phosphoglucomutase-like phosphatase (HAD superfamily)
VLTVDPRAKALIFDIDGTLVDTMPIHAAAWKRVLADHGVSIDDDYFHEHLGGHPTGQIIQIINEKFDVKLNAAQVGAEKDRAFVANVTMVQPIRPVVEIVESSYGVLPLGLATNETAGIANMSMRTAGLAHYFSVMVTLDEIERPKPDPEIFLLCAERLGMDPQVCQVFEDSERGLEGARRAGMIVSDVRTAL